MKKTRKATRTPAAAGPVRLNIGSGGVAIPGYIGIDRKDGGEAYPLAYNDGRPVPDESVDEVYASHVLEHFPFAHAVNVLREWARVLKPGGVMKIAVPNFDWCMDELEAGNPKNWPIEGYIMGGQTDEDDFHHGIFNPDKLRTMLLMAGIGDVRAWRSTAKDCASLPVSLNLMGTKGAPAVPNLRGVVAGLISMPRLAFTDNMFCAMSVLSKLGVPIQRHSGAFWGQCLQRLMEGTCDEHKYLMTIDYDSLFSVDDVANLFRLMEENPNADAICAVQMGRDRNTALMTVVDERGKVKSRVTRDELDADLMQLASAHFGLTMIRSASLKKVALPWFLGKPGKGGRWGEDRVDDDVYFWKKWHAAGLRVYQANRVPIGHVQTVATWPSRDLRPVHQSLTEWQENGVPLAARR